MFPTPLLLDSFRPQQYLYDCAAASVANIANTLGIEYDQYDDLLKELHVSSRWWTNPKYISDFFSSRHIEFSSNFSDINILLVSQHLFYQQASQARASNNYGHYLLALASRPGEYLVYDVWGGGISQRTEEDLRQCMQKVLVGRTKRYTDICFGFSFS